MSFSGILIPEKPEVYNHASGMQGANETGY